MERVLPEFGGAYEEGTNEVRIRVDNKEDNYYYMWTLDKFQDRILNIYNT